MVMCPLLSKAQEPGAGGWQVSEGPRHSVLQTVACAGTMCAWWVVEGQACAVQLQGQLALADLVAAAVSENSGRVDG